jgi:hypothetical protein
MTPSGDEDKRGRFGSIFVGVSGVLITATAGVGMFTGHASEEVVAFGVARTTSVGGGEQFATSSACLK